MRILTVVLVAVLALFAVSCSSNSADDLGLDTVGHFMLDKAGITTDVDPDDLGATDLTDEEMEALLVVGDDFENSDDIWLEYLATDDGTAACQSAYESANS